MVPCVSVSRLMCSMTSISPEAGHPTDPMLAPSAQNAGQSPCPIGRDMRASIRPYANPRVPRVFMRVYVYWQVPYQQEKPPLSRRAVMVSRPPDTVAFAPLV